MRIATLADIHGNLPALEAVRADLRQQGVDEVWLLGDQISRIPWDNEVLDLCAAEGWPAIYGNHELVIGRLYTEQSPFRDDVDRARFIALYWTQENLRAEHLEAIRALPGERIVRHAGLPPIHLTHGVPGNPFWGFFPGDTDEEILRHLEGVEEPLTIVGHTHRPMDRTVNDSTGNVKRVINGGAVGLPYNGDVRAQYLILEGKKGAWTPIFRQVAYDNSRMARGFQESGMAAAMGGYGTLHLWAAMTAEPWSSDFAWWLGRQSADAYASVDEAVEKYLQMHGPHNWAFKGGKI